MGFNLGRLLRSVLPFALIAIPFIGQGLVAAGVLGGAAAAGGGAVAGFGSAIGSGGFSGFASTLARGVFSAFTNIGGGLFGGGAAAGAGAAAGGGGILSTAFKAGGLALNIFGQIKQGRAQADYFRAQQQIAALNAKQIKELLPLQLEAFEEEIVSIGESREIRERDIAELRKRASRQGEFTFESLERAESLNVLGEAGIRERSTLASTLVTTQLGIIVSRATEKTRQIDAERGRLVGTASQVAARGGTRVGGGSIESIREEVTFEARQATEEIQRERDQALTETAIADRARVSQVQEQLSAIGLKNLELEQQRREVQQGLEDATFDAALELEITQRNAEIAVERVEFNIVLAQKRADIEGLQQDILAGAAAERARAEALAGILGPAALLLREAEFATFIGSIPDPTGRAPPPPRPSGRTPVTTTPPWRAGTPGAGGRGRDPYTGLTE